MSRPKKASKEVKPIAVLPRDQFGKYSGALVFEARELWEAVKGEGQERPFKSQVVLPLDAWVLAKDGTIVAAVKKNPNLRYYPYYNMFLIVLPYLLHASGWARLPKKMSTIAYPFADHYGARAEIIQCKFTEGGVKGRITAGRGVDSNLYKISKLLKREKDSQNNTYLRGTDAEEYLFEIAQAPFSVATTYLNPVYLPANEELCDLLVLIDNFAIIWQVKGLKVNKRTGQHNKKETRKNRSQLLKAKERLLDRNGSIRLENNIWNARTRNFSGLKRVFLISALLGEEQAYYRDDIKDGNLILEFSKKNLDVLLTNLDTPGDFVNYLGAREEFYRCKLKSSLPVRVPDEKTLISHYLRTGTLADLCNCNHLPIAENEQGGIGRKKSKRNYPGRRWDDFINRAFIPGDPESEQAVLLTEIIRPVRADRTKLAAALKKILKRILREKEPKHYWIPLPELDLTFVYFCEPRMPMSRQEAIKKAALPLEWPKNTHRTSKVVLIADSLLGDGKQSAVHLVDIADRIQL